MSPMGELSGVCPDLCRRVSSHVAPPLINIPATVRGGNPWPSMVASTKLIGAPRVK